MNKKQLIISYESFLKQDNEDKYNMLEEAVYEIESLNNTIEKAVEYITNTEDMCYYGKCNDGDLLIKVEEDFKNDLLDILNGRSDE